MASRQRWRQYVLVVTLCITYAAHAQSNNLPTRFSYNLVEEQSSGYYIANIKSSARLEQYYNDTVLDTLRFQFLIRPSLSVALDHVTGALTTSGVIDRDVICARQTECNVTLEIALQPPQYFHIFKVTLSILDLNDITPTFPQESIAKTISESASIGDKILLPTASDDDSPSLGVQRYELRGADSWAFDLETTTRLDGVNEVRLVLLVKLDREGKDRYFVKVWAFDGGEPANSAYIDVTINVQDFNDNPPVFVNSTYHVTLPENYQLGSPFLVVEARDPDVGLNGALSYGLSPYTTQLYGGVFGINSRTGALSLEQPLDYETTSTYTLSVTAVDKGTDPRRTEASVVVTVHDVNDEHPRIFVNTLSRTDVSEAEVSENQAAETFVAHVSVKDDDSGPNGDVTCSLSDPFFKLVKMFEKDFKVVSKRILDRENISRHDVVIVCRDAGQEPLQSVKHLVVHVTDENDSSPVFAVNFYNISVFENNVIGSHLAQVSATDADDGLHARVEYFLEASVSHHVAINSSTGVIQALRSFDREHEATIEFQVIAMDSGSITHSSLATVRIHVLDINDERPLFAEAIKSFSFAENNSIGSLVGQLQAHDGDAYPYNTTEYSLLPTNESVLFTVDPKHGWISALVSFDREYRAHYDVTVVASDVHDPALFSAIDVLITVDDVNDNAPMFIYPTDANHSVTISAHVPNDYVIAKLSAFDMDKAQNAMLSYVITGGNRKQYFNLQESSGFLTVAQTFHNIDYKEFKLEVKVQDGGNPTLFSISTLCVTVDSSIAYADSHTSRGTLTRSKLVIITILAILSAIICVILVVAIVFLRRLERRRKLQQKQKSRMAGLAKLTVNSETAENVRQMADRSKSKTADTATNLWRSPSKSQLEAEVSLLLPSATDLTADCTSIWNASDDVTSFQAKSSREPWSKSTSTFSMSTLTRSPHHVTDQGHETDASADEASTSDSGRGNSEDGDVNGAKASVMSDCARAAAIVSRRSESPTFRTFTAVNEPHEHISTTGALTTNDSQFKLVYARPANVIVSSSPAPSAVTSSLAGHKGAVVNYPVDAAAAATDPKRARVYYKNFPNYQSPSSYHPGLLDAAGNIKVNTSTFV